MAKNLKKKSIKKRNPYQIAFLKGELQFKERCELLGKKKHSRKVKHKNNNYDA